MMAGAAIYSYQGTVSNNIIQSNTATFTGGVYINEGSATGNHILGNTATNGGGLYGNLANLLGNTIEGNSATLGGGILSTDSTVRGNIVTGNNASADGGGIYAEGGTVTSNTITENTVPSYGHGSGAYILGVTSFTYNHVVDNTGGAGTFSVSRADLSPAIDGLAEQDVQAGRRPYECGGIAVALPVGGASLGRFRLARADNGLAFAAGALAAVD